MNDDTITTNNTSDNTDEAQAELSGGTSAAQALLSSGTSIAHNITIQNKTTDYPKPLQGLDEAAGTEANAGTSTAKPPHKPLLASRKRNSKQPAPPPPDDGNDSFAGMAAKAIADEQFQYPYLSSGQFTQATLHAWLMAFNRMLRHLGSPPKSEYDYRRHFANWIKYRDTAREDPHACTGLPTQLTASVNAANAYLKPATTAAAEQAAQQQAAVALAMQHARNNPLLE